MNGSEVYDKYSVAEHTWFALVAGSVLHEPRKEVILEVGVSDNAGFKSIITDM